MTEAARLCEVSADVVGVTGAGVMLMWAGVARGWVCASNQVSRAIEDLQYTLGEGPGVDACILDEPVLEPDLAGPDAAARWVAFTPRALAAGAGAIFAFPMKVGAIRLGALNLYRARPEELSDDQHAGALAMAGVAARAVLGMQAHARPGALGVELEAGLGPAFVVHQASGIVAAALDVTVGEALVRLRAYAFGHDRLLVDVAREVVERRLSLG